MCVCYMDTGKPHTHTRPARQLAVQCLKTIFSNSLFSRTIVMNAFRPICSAYARCDLAAWSSIPTLACWCDVYIFCPTGPGSLRQHTLSLLPLPPLYLPFSLFPVVLFSFVIKSTFLPVPFLPLLGNIFFPSPGQSVQSHAFLSRPRSHGCLEPQEGGRERERNNLSRFGEEKNQRRRRNPQPR